jgi:xylulokinase
MGCMLSAASCNKWWMEEILKTGDFSGEQAPIDERAAAGKLGENHVYFLPYLMGERSPHNDPQAKGAFIGMSLDTSRADMLQAVFEGVAFALRDSLEVARRLGVAPTRTTICGGGAKSPLWRKIVANIMNLSVDTVEVEEGPAYGGAILAAVADGAFADVEQATAKIVRIKDTTEPDAALVKKYEACYRKFVRMYPALKDTFRTLMEE